MKTLTQAEMRQRIGTDIGFPPPRNKVSVTAVDLPEGMYYWNSSHGLWAMYEPRKPMKLTVTREITQPYPALALTSEVYSIDGEELAQFFARVANIINLVPAVPPAPAKKPIDVALALHFLNSTEEQLNREYEGRCFCGDCKVAKVKAILQGEKW